MKCIVNKNNNTNCSANMGISWMSGPMQVAMQKEIRYERRNISTTQAEGISRGSNVEKTRG